MHWDPSVLRSATVAATYKALLNSLPAIAPGQSIILWRSCPLAELRLGQWGEAAALHHLPSGKTHFINRSTLVLLQTVLQEEKTADEAAVELAGIMAVATSLEFASQVAELIDRLDALGLVASRRCVRAPAC
jgi:PqqD family protein of HPr-rel-A system